MVTLTATYSPDDNKLRLYASARLDDETYNCVKEAGFKWAPRQQLFVAPAWTPAREDLLLSLCGQIDDEDKSLAERAEDAAESFGQLSQKRAEESNVAHTAARNISQSIPLGQPILVDHYSANRHRRDISRIDNNMRKAVSLWETSEYWQRRASRAVAHAAYKERPDVRHRRIKSLETDLRKHKRNADEAAGFLKLWSAENLDGELVLQLAGSDHLYVRIDQESQLLYWALKDGKIDATKAVELAKGAHERHIAYAERWVAHLNNRISYERAMLGEGGGLPARQFDIQVGGKVFVRGSWQTVLRVNRRGGQINGVTTDCRFVPLRGIEEVKDYQAPTAEEAAEVAGKVKLPPLVNFEMPEAQCMTKADWEKINRDYKRTKVCAATEEHGAYRYRSAIIPGSGFKTAPVFLTDAKVTMPPKACS